MFRHAQRPAAADIDDGALRESSRARRVHETGGAVIVVQDGEPAAVLIDASESRPYARCWVAEKCDR